LALSLVSLGLGNVSGAAPKKTGAYHLGTIFHSNVADAPYQWEQAFSAYWDYVNAKGGVNGYKVDLTQEDNQSEASLTATEFKTLEANPKNLAIAGFDLSSNTSPEVPVANKDHITMFIGAGVLQSSILPHDTPWVFESAELFTDTIAAMAGFAKTKGWTKVALLYFDGPDAVEANTIVQKYLPTAGMTIVTTQYLPFTTSADYTSEVEAAVTGGAQVIFGLEGPSAFVAIHQAEVGLGANIPVLANPPGLNLSVYQAFGSSFYAADSNWYLNPAAPGWHAMATAMKAHYLIPADNITADNVGGWVDGEIFAAALKACGKPSVCTRVKFRNALQGLKNVTFGGLAAPVSFSATDHYAPTATEFYGVGSKGALGAISAPIPYPVKGQ
jgi:branched-chain amino acid transport system substrate-binding protein